MSNNNSNDNNNNNNSAVREMNSLEDIFQHRVEYFSHSEDESGTNFLTVDLVDSNQWIKIMLYPDFTWMSLSVNEGRFCLNALSEKEPNSNHYRKPYLFGLLEDLILPSLLSTMTRVDSVMNYDTKKPHREVRAANSFNRLFFCIFKREVK